MEYLKKQINIHKGKLNELVSSLDKNKDINEISHNFKIEQGILASLKNMVIEETNKNIQKK